ncbi:unnamed protein product [Sphagnum jensenii]
MVSGQHQKDHCSLKHHPVKLQIFPRQQKIFNVCNKHAAKQFLLHMQIIQLGTIWNEHYRETKKLHLEKTCKLMTGI